MWIPPGAAPEEYLIRFHVVQPTWQWPDFVPGALSVFESLSGADVAKTEFYGSLFVEVRTAPAVVLTTLQVFSGDRLPVTASGEPGQSSGDAVGQQLEEGQPNARTVRGLMDGLVCNAGALVLCAIGVMWVQEQHYKEADGKGNMLAAVKDCLNQPLAADSVHRRGAYERRSCSS